MLKGAEFSECRTYRYVLWRSWDKSKGYVMFIGLNPSTADEMNDDPTIRRCINFARSWGYGGIYMLNLFAFRATEPKDMKLVYAPVGPGNNRALYHYHSVSKITLACWGTHGAYVNRDRWVKENLNNLYCLGITKNGHPKHPLYLKADLKPYLLKEPKREICPDCKGTKVDMSLGFPTACLCGTSIKLKDSDE